jgi:hypothetical protein
LLDKSYAPNPVEIQKGDIIRFVNKDSVLHTATSGDGATATQSGVFDSGFLGPNRSAEVTINEVGEFPYYCQAHPTMVGLVKVSEATTPVGGEFRVTTSHDGKDFEVVGSSASGAKATQLEITPEVSIDLTIEGSGEIDLTLPTTMIEGITMINSTSGESLPFTKINESDSATTIRFSMPENTDGQISIMGARVVPEFHAIVLTLVLIGAIASGIFFTRGIKGWARPI